MSEQRFPHEIVPEPNEATGTAAEWATYHLARAQAAEQLSMHLAGTDQFDAQMAAVTVFIGEFAQAFLLEHVSDEVARELAGILAAGDVAPEIIWERLEARGIDPRGIKRFATREESASKRAAEAAR